MRMAVALFIAVAPTLYAAPPTTSSQPADQASSPTIAVEIKFIAPGVCTAFVADHAPGDEASVRDKAVLVDANWRSFIGQELRSRLEPLESNSVQSTIIRLDQADRLLRHAMESLDFAVIDAPRILSFDGKAALVAVESYIKVSPTEQKPSNEKLQPLKQYTVGRRAKVTPTIVPGENKISLQLDASCTDQAGNLRILQAESKGTCSLSSDAYWLIRMPLQRYQLVGSTPAPPGSDKPSLPVKELVEPQVAEGAVYMVVRAYVTTLDAPAHSRPANAPSPSVGLYYVSGRILRPGTYALTGEPITLRQAIAAAGGLKGKLFRARATCEIARQRPGKGPVRRVVDLDRLLAGKAVDIVIEPDDHLNVRYDGVKAFDWQMAAAHSGPAPEVAGRATGS